MRPQDVGPRAIPRWCEVQVVDGHAFEELAVLVGELVVDAEEADGLAVGESGDAAVGLGDDAVGLRIIVTREDGHQVDGGARGLGLAGL